jgi:diphthamide synthase (EF-2-diphthine--ammonia ligase)
MPRPKALVPCGERGELHTFAWAGPMFGRAIPVDLGEVVTREGFVFADLLWRSNCTERRTP